MANSQAVAIKTLQTAITGDVFRERVSSFIADSGQRDKMINVLATEIARNPKLAQCNKQSVLLAALRCARYNLEPGEGLACLIPRGGQCDFQLEYRGMLLLMHRTGQLRDIRCEVVHENDPVWEFEQGNQFEDGYHLRHKRLWGGDRGRMMAVYAVARLTNGGEYPVAMDRREVEQIRDEASQNTGPNSPWRKWEAAMWRKTCLKQLAKVCPLSADIVSADRVDDLALVGVDQMAPAGIDPEEIEALAAPSQEQVATQVSELVEQTDNGGGADSTPVSDSVEPMKSPVASPVPGSSDKPARKRSVKHVEKDNYLDMAMSKNNWSKKEAIKQACEWAQKDTVKLTADDWKYCQDKLNIAPILPESKTLEDRFVRGVVHVPPSGEIREDIGPEPELPV